VSVVAVAELRLGILMAASRGRPAGRKAPVNDSWIAATAIARGIPVATQDDDYDGMPGLRVIHL
jgi:predicted nucleic acid-binding protein